MGETVAWIGCGVMWFGMDGPSHSPRTFQYRISEQASEICDVRGGDGEAQQLSQCLEEVEAVDVRHRALDDGADLRFDVFLWLCLIGVVCVRCLIHHRPPCSAKINRADRCTGVIAGATGQAGS